MSYYSKFEGDVSTILANGVYYATGGALVMALYYSLRRRHISSIFVSLHHVFVFIFHCKFTFKGTFPHAVDVFKNVHMCIC